MLAALAALLSATAALVALVLLAFVRELTAKCRSATRLHPIQQRTM
jgi:hypothetical protein